MTGVYVYHFKTSKVIKKEENILIIATLREVETEAKVLLFN